MVNERVIERLRRGDWCTECNNAEEVDVSLHACDEAGITWCNGWKTTERKPYKRYPVEIGFCKKKEGLTKGTTGDYKDSECENITDWFFNAIKKNDDNGKLTPQNAEQEHMVQILLAIMQKIPVEVNIGGEWRTSTILFPGMGYEYCIKPTPTPLHMSRWMWRKINKKWQFIAMDKDGQVFLYMKRPHPKRGEYGGYWYKGSAYCVEFPFYINTDGINWETSLTERPEGV